MWMDIKDFPNYEVSHLGEIRNKKTQRILKLHPNSRGYLRAQISNKDGRFNLMIHKLVASLFLGERPKNKQSNHKDGNKRNNAIGNLEYLTQSENMKHAFKLGLIIVPLGTPFKKGYIPWNKRT